MEMTQFTPESQRQRWIKYGLNVLLSTIVVIVLAVLVVYLAQRPRFDHRVDTTSSGSYSLKPQTINLLSDLKQKVKLVSLYAAKDVEGRDNPNADRVRDLLDEYAQHSSNVETDSIDPVKQPSKTDALINDAMQKYGGAIGAYRDFVTNFQAKTFSDLKTRVDAETAALAAVSTDSLSGQDTRSQNAMAVIDTVRDEMPKSLTTMKDRVDRSLKAKFPDYKAIVDRIKDSLDSLTEVETAIIKYAQSGKDDAKLPDAFRKYLADSVERHQAIAKIVDDATKAISGLGELKVGELQQAMKGQDLVLVLGEKEWRVVNSDQIFVTDSRDLRGYTEGQKLKPRFAGEQAVTSALLAVTQSTKSKIAFVRAGGAPLTNPGFPPFQAGGPLSDIADRLRASNFDVVEKDLSGQYAMQAQMQGGAPPTEPSDEELKSAVWIVLDTPPEQQQQQMGRPPASPVDAKLGAHLKEGGSALVLATPGSDALVDSMKEYGVTLHADAVIVKEVPKVDHPEGGDLAEQAQWLPFVFVANEYGDAPFTAPLKSLDSILIGDVPVTTTATPGVQTFTLLPIPQTNRTWGETNIESAQGDNLSFDKNTDIAPPLFAGAAATKGSVRLVVLGGLQGFTNRILSVPDQDLLKRGVVVSRFPGNAELITNAVYWLAKMDTMIAISPQAMEVSRIAPMSDAALGFWRIGVLLVALPGLVVAAGIYVYFARRD